MSLLEDLATASKPRAICPAAIVLASLSAPELAAISAALASKMPGTTIAGILRKNDHDISDDALQTHRRGACPCPTS